MRVVLIAVGFSAIFAASCVAEPATTGAAAAMRAAPSAKARIVQHVPANAEIDLSRCSGKWCYASWRDRFGYLPAASIAAQLYSAAPGPADGAHSAWSDASVGPFYFGYGWSRW